MDEVQERYMDDRFTWAVWCFAEEQWIEPSDRWPNYWFDRNSYSRWATCEILELLLDRDNHYKPSTIVEQFRDKMDEYSCYNEASRHIFTIATEAANDILDLIRAME